jgi:hypothetical protein
VVWPPLASGVRLSQARRNTRAERIRRLIDRVVDASRGRGKHVRVSPPPFTRDIREGVVRDARGEAGVSGGSQRARTSHEYVWEMVITRKTSGLVNRASKMREVKPLPLVSDGKEELATLWLGGLVTA